MLYLLFTFDWERESKRAIALVSGYSAASGELNGLIAGGIEEGVEEGRECGGEDGQERDTLLRDADAFAAPNTLKKILIG